MIGRFTPYSISLTTFSIPYLVRSPSARDMYRETSRNGLLLLLMIAAIFRSRKTLYTLNQRRFVSTTAGTQNGTGTSLTKYKSAYDSNVVPFSCIITNNEACQVPPYSKRRVPQISTVLNDAQFTCLLNLSDITTPMFKNLIPTSMRRLTIAIVTVTSFSFNKVECTLTIQL